jgi:hypothetical protein
MRGKDCESSSTWNHARAHRRVGQNRNRYSQYEVGGPSLILIAQRLKVLELDTRDGQTVKLVIAGCTGVKTPEWDIGSTQD